MKKMIMKAGIALLLAASLLMGSCGGMFDEGTKPSGNSAINTEINKLGSFNQPEPLDEPLAELVPEGTPGRPANWDGYPNSQVYLMTTAERFDELSIFENTREDVMWLGSILDGNSITTGEYLPVTAKRAGFKFYTTANIDDATSGYETELGVVSEASYSNVQKAINHITSADLLKELPAIIEFEKEFVYSRDQLQVALGANFSGWGLKLKTSFNWEDTKIKTRMLIKYRQVYYTLSMDYIDKPANAFASDVTYADIAGQIRGPVAPVIVSSVKYGRMAYFVIESESMEKDVGAAFEAAYSSVCKVGGSFSTTQKDIVQKSRVKAFVFGGSASAGAQMITIGADTNSNFNIDSFLTWIREDDTNNLKTMNPTVPPAVPLAYRLTYLKNWTPAALVFANQYYRITLPAGGGAPVYPKVKLASATLGTGMKGEIEYGPGSYRTIYGVLHAIVSIDKYYEINGNPVKYGSTAGTQELMVSADQGNKTYNLDAGVEFNDGPSLANAYVIVRVGGTISDFPGGPYQDVGEKKVYLSDFDANPDMTVDIKLPNCQGSVKVLLKAAN
jgi:hypothetical protein